VTAAAGSPDVQTVFDGRGVLADLERSSGGRAGQRWWARCAPFGVPSQDYRLVRADADVWTRSGPPLPLCSVGSPPRLLGSVWSAVLLHHPGSGVELAAAGTLLEGVRFDESLAGGWPALDLVPYMSGPGLTPSLTWAGLWEFQSVGLRGLSVTDRPAWPGRTGFWPGAPPW